MVRVPFFMKFRIEWYDCRMYEGRNIVDSFVRSIRYALATNIKW